MHFQCFPFSPNSDAFETLETLKNGARIEEIAKTDATAVIFAFVQTFTANGNFQV